MIKEHRGPLCAASNPGWRTTPGTLGWNDAADVDAPVCPPGRVGVHHLDADDGGVLVAQRTRRGTRRRKGRRQRAGASGKTVFVVAGGFEGFASEAAEAEFLEKLKDGTITQRWSPNTVDFMATAGDSGASSPWTASDAGEFLGAVHGVNGRIRRLIFIGHGSPHRLGLSGKLHERRFTASIGRDDLADAKWSAAIAGIRAKFVDGATFDIYACNVAASEKLMKAFANAFDVRVRSFKTAVWWCVNHDADGKTITSRGRVGPGGGPAACSEKPWKKGVLKWAPPVTVDPD